MNKRNSHVDNIKR